MPLLGYFIVVGSALIGLLYVANAVLPQDARQISSNFEGIPQARQTQHTAPVLAPAPKPDVFSTAARPQRRRRPGSRPRKIMRHQRRWRRTGRRVRSASTSPVNARGRAILHKPTAGPTTGRAAGVCTADVGMIRFGDLKARAHIRTSANPQPSTERTCVLRCGHQLSIIMMHHAALLLDHGEAAPKGRHAGPVHGAALLLDD
jgi:hypothetical protein